MESSRMVFAEGVRERLFDIDWGLMGNRSRGEEEEDLCLYMLRGTCLLEQVFAGYGQNNPFYQLGRARLGLPSLLLPWAVTIIDRHWKYDVCH